MTQICPDCGKKWPDDSNYCSNCRAKLPNAPKRFPDYKKIGESVDIDVDEFKKLISISFDSPIFVNRLLLRILQRAIDGVKSDSPEEKYLSGAIFRMLSEELMNECKSISTQ